MEEQTTELQFLLELLFEHKLQAATKRLIKERVRFVEQQLIPPPRQIVPRGTTQAPSTLANLAAHSEPAAADPIAAPIPPKAPPIALSRVVGGEIGTGKGTRGPRKF